MYTNAIWFLTYHLMKPNTALMVLLCPPYLDNPSNFKLKTGGTTWFILINLKIGMTIQSSRSGAWRDNCM